MKKKIFLILLIFMCSFFIIGCSNSKETVDVNASNSQSNKQILSSLNDYKEMINADLKSSDFSDNSINSFKKLTSYNFYDLYMSTFTDNVEIFLLINSSNSISQIRYKVDLSSTDVKLCGYLLGATMRLMYSDIDEDLNEFYEELGMTNPVEGINNTYIFKDNIYRTIVKDNYLTIYITPSNSKNDEEIFTNINYVDESKYYINTYDKNSLYFDDTDIRWGMSDEELNDIKTLYKCYKDFTNNDGKVVRYYYHDYYGSTNSYYLKTTQYWVYKDTGKLNSIMLEFKDDGATYANYLNVKEALIEKYGTPTKEDLKYNDDTYKDNPEKAIKYDYLTIKTTWDNQEGFDIILNWSNDLATITYCEKGYNGNW